MNKSTIRIGDRVTVKEREQAYYSGRDGRPKVFLEPGTVGIVGAIDVPYVNRNGSFCCVDFQGPTFWGRSDNSEWRAGVDYQNIVKVDLR